MSHQIKRILDLTCWGIPLGLYVLSWYFQAQYRFPQSNVLWKEYWHQAYYFYLLTMAIHVILYFESGVKSVKETVIFFRAPILGFLLAMFSYAFAALTRDVINVLFLIIFRRPLFMY